MVLSVRLVFPRSLRPAGAGAAEALFEHTSCGLAEPGVDYLLSTSYLLPNVESLDACCAQCQVLPECMAWTWVSESGLRSGSATECYLKGGKFHNRTRKMFLDGEPIPVKLTSGNATGRHPPEDDMATGPFNLAVVHHVMKPVYTCPKEDADLPEVAPPAGSQEGAQGANVSILSYNLFWWNLFDQGRRSEYHYFHETPGNGAIDIMAKHARSFDLLAFQECIDIGWVLDKAGMAAEYEGHQGPEEMCLAFRKETWEKQGQGWTYVGEDRPEEFWRRRGVQWVQLLHKASDRMVLFMDHHGPLPVGSGGTCGGKGTAHNLLKVAAEKGKGRAVILAGDFNSGRDSGAIEALRNHWTQAMRGVSFGGVDNIFTNLDKGSVVETARLGSGGSDHDAITAVLRIGQMADAPIEWAS